MVTVLAGKDKGKKGKVIRVITKKAKLVVEGVNVAKRHQRPTRNFPGGIVDKALPLPSSKVMVVCPKCAVPSRVKMVEVAGERVRGCARCEEAIDKV